MTASQHSQPVPSRPMGVPLLVLALLGVLTASVTWRVAKGVEEQERARFDELVQSAYQALAASVEYDLNSVRSLQGLLHSRYVSRPDGTPGGVALEAEEWSRYLASLNWRRNYPNQLDLGFARRIRGTNGAPDAFVVVHLDSRLDGNRHQVGLDLAADPVHRDTMAIAAEFTSPMSSPVVNLSGPGLPAHNGTVVYLPVFEGGRAPKGRAERRAAVAGFVFNSTVTTNTFRSLTVGRTNPVIHLEFEEAAAVRGGPQPAQGLSPTRRRPDGALEAVLTTIGIGRLWHIRFRSLPEFAVDTPRRLPWLVAGLGGVFSLLVFGLTAVQARGRARADRLNLDLRRSEEAIQRLNRDLERRIEDRTAELVAINLRLGNEVAERQKSETALRELEELYRRAIASADAVPYRRDYATERFTFIGDGIEALTGYPAGEMTPQLWETLVEESCLRGELAGLEVPEAVRRVRAGEFSRWRDDCRIRRQDGAVRWVCDSSVEIPGADGRPVGSVGFLLDITERKRAEEELVKALALEKELGRLKSQFVATVSHEFRTPLGIILSSAEILDRYFDRLTPAARREQLEAIQAAVRRMAGLMENVLVLSRAEAGRLDCQPAPLQLPAFCERIVEEVRAASHERCPIRLACDVASMAQGVGAAGAPAADASSRGTVHGDENLLRHIFLNLLSNAVKYSPAGEPVEFRARAEGAQVIFEVRDRGIGIPPEERDRLFEAFRRGRNVGHIDGTGLGLSIVKRCVDLHGGRIRIEDAPGGGTVFVVSLPLLAPER